MVNFINNPLFLSLMINVNKLERLVKEIFVDSFKKVSFQQRNWDISMFNVERVRKQIEAEIEKEYKERVPYPDYVMSSLDELSTSIREAGGITRQIYETHHSTLNTIARTLTKTNIRISGGYYDLAEEDSKSVELVLILSI